MSDVEQSSPLTSKIKKWLGKVGYPLEFRTADALQRHGFNTEQGVYISDKSTDKLREIDLIGVSPVSTEGGNTTVNVTLVVECKWSDDKPWVAFSSRSSMRTARVNLFSTLPFSCLLAEAVLWTSAQDPRLDNFSLFSATEHVPFAIRRALGDNKRDEDQCYAAVQGVVGAARTMVGNIRGAQPNGLMALGLMWIVRPVVVIKSPLFEAYLDSTGQDFVVQDRSWLRLAWHGTLAGAPYVVVDVVTEAGLSNYLTSITGCFPELLTTLETSHHAVTQAQLDNDLTPVLELRKGMLNEQLPALLVGLQRK